jgi:hypothetical protein
VGDHWIRWHQAYDDAANPLNERRRHVVEAVTRYLDTSPPGPLTILSLCAGDATDLASALGRHPRRRDASGAAIELDPELARRAVANLRGAAVDLEVRTADAGDAATFSDLLPVDLLLLVGIFGNISDADIERTVATVPALCRPGATIIWTRHRRPPDVSPRVRDWFEQHGCTHLRFDSPAPGGWAVGTERLDRRSSAGAPVGPAHLFTFLPRD